MKSVLPRKVWPVIAMVAVACGPRADRVDTAMDTTAAEAPREHAMVRVINAVPGNGAVDIHAGPAETFTMVNFKTVSPYRAISEFRPKFIVVPAGQPTAQPLAENAEVVLDGRYYTVLAIPTKDPADADGPRVEIIAIRDQPLPDDASKGRVRVINAATPPATGDPELDVTTEGATEALFNDLAFKNEGSKELSPGVITLLVMQDDSKSVILRVPSVRVEAGKSITIVLVRATPGGKLEAITVADEPMGAARPDSMVKPDTTYR